MDVGNVFRGGILAQLVPADATLTDIYTVPAPGQIISFITATNLTGAAVVVVIEVAPAGEAHATKHAICGAVVAANESHDHPMGAKLPAGAIIRVKGADDTAFTIWG
jgi:hypothetical protein